MRNLFRLLVLGLLVGGWALASSSLYLVRSPGGHFEQVGNLALIPKDHLTFRDTYVDTRKWTAEDLEKHACAVARINATHHGDLLKHVSLSASTEVALGPGVTRGMTVVDPSGRLGTPTVTLLEEARIDRLAALYAASVRFTPPPRR